jgi:hypothetical protein
MFFWVWVPCGLAGRNQRFGEAYCLLLQGSSDHAGNQRDYIWWPIRPFLFRLPFLPPYIIPLNPSMVTSALKMEAVRFSETLASTSQSTRRPNPKEHHQYRHRRENLKSKWDNCLSCSQCFLRKHSYSGVNYHKGFE